MFCGIGCFLHDADDFRRIRADCRFIGDHDGGCAVGHRIEDVGYLRPCRHGVIDHAGEHLCHDKEGNLRRTAFCGDVFLHAGQLWKRDIIAEISAGNDDHVRALNNLIDPGKTFPVFNFGKDADLFCIVFLQRSTHRFNILCRPHKWLHHRTDAVRYRKRKIKPVGFRQGGHRHGFVFDLDAFA